MRFCVNCAVDDPESATSSEEDEPLPGVAAALTASTPPLPRPAVPLGADFGMSERQREKERKEGGRENRLHVCNWEGDCVTNVFGVCCRRFGQLSL